jgi:mersacidin/lichenicidin family type 2 lantibiotic
MKVDIIRAWKDPVYRETLGTDAPKHPAGLIELTDEELKEASGILAMVGTTCECCTDTSRPRRCCP